MTNTDASEILGLLTRAFAPRCPNFDEPAVLDDWLRALVPFPTTVGTEAARRILDRAAATPQTTWFPAMVDLLAECQHVARQHATQRALAQATANPTRCDGTGWTPTPDGMTRCPTCNPGTPPLPPRCTDLEPAP